MELALLIAVILAALVFTYTNGFHDTANSIATVVGTKVLTPRQAILLAAVTNLFGSFFGLAVARTISSGLVDSQYVSQTVLICALSAAIFWNLWTWWLGLPSSSSHALVGSLCGATLAAAHGNWSAIKWIELKAKTIKTLVDPSGDVLAAIGSQAWPDGTSQVQVGATVVKLVSFCGQLKMVTETPGVEKAGVFYKVVLPMLSSPVIGFVGGLLVMSVLYVTLRNWRPTTVSRAFGRLQLASSAYMGFSHGMNDATKCMGIVTLALVAATSAGLFGHLPPVLQFLNTTAGSDPTQLSLGDQLVRLLPAWLQFGYMPSPVDVQAQAVPNWVVVLCALTMAAGTAAGGWRIIKTLGHRMVKLQPVHGFAAETTAATVLAFTGHLGMPVSTTHAISTSIMGVGCAKRFSALKVGIVERVIWAWIFTIPATMLAAFVLVWLTQQIGWK